MNGALQDEDIVVLIPLLRVYARFLAKSNTHAEDLVQDTLERALRGKAGFQPDSNLKAWLFTILRNRFIDEHRKHRDTVEDVDGQNAAKLVSPASQYWSAQCTDVVSAIDRLAPDVREAIMLVVGGGVSHEEAAAILGCPLGTLKSRIRRARLRLLEVVEVAPQPAELGSAAVG